MTRVSSFPEPLIGRLYIQTLERSTEPAPQPERSTHATPVFGTYDDFATAIVTAHLENGAMVVISGTRASGVGYDVRMEVFGTADSIAVGLDPHTPIRTVEPVLDLPRPPMTVRWLDRFGSAYQAALVVAAASRKAAVEQRPVFIEVIG